MDSLKADLNGGNSVVLNPKVAAVDQVQSLSGTDLSVDKPVSLVLASGEGDGLLLRKIPGANEIEVTRDTEEVRTILLSKPVQR